ncbi:MAG: hypothetical protein ACXVXU_18915, partial [Blastococcus sp.]
MRRYRFLILVLAVVAALVQAGLAAGAASASQPADATPTNIDVSQRHLNESEESVAVNPTNPANIVIVTNVG